MSKTMVLASFSELRNVLNVEEAATAPDEEIIDAGAIATTETQESSNRAIADLLTELERARATLATIARRDQEARTLALSELEQYDALMAEQREASKALYHAQQLRKRVEAMAANAFEDEAKEAAAQLANIPQRIEAEAARLVDQFGREIEDLTQRLDIQRLLTERKRLEEFETARAARAERARRLSDALAWADSALEREQFEEARAMLGPVTNEHPGNAEIASLLDSIAQRELAVKMAWAEDALWMTRRDYRFEPATAVERLAAVDTSALPEATARQVFGAWASACMRLCRQRQLHEPLRFGAGPGCGLVFAREAADLPYVVVSAIGMRERWDIGSVAPDGLLQRCLPLR
ncbi:MAG: hypothetical protein ACYDAG_04645 [Chloroflexota bacterium]